MLFHTDAVQAAGHLPIDVKAHAHRYASLSRSQVPRPQGRRRSVCPAGRTHHQSHLRRRTGAGQASRYGEPARHRRHGRGAWRMPAPTWRRTRAKVTRSAGQADCGTVADPPQRSQRRPGRTGCPATSTFCFEGIEGESLLLLLDDCGHLRPPPAPPAPPVRLDPSHVLLAIGRPHEVAHGSLRLTSERAEPAVGRSTTSCGRFPGWWRICGPCRRYGTELEPGCEAVHAITLISERRY